MLTALDLTATGFVCALENRPDFAEHVRALGVTLGLQNWSSDYASEEEQLFSPVRELLSLCTATTASRIRVEPEQERLSAEFGESLGKLDVNQHLVALDSPFAGAGSLHLASKLPLLRRLSHRDYNSARDESEMPPIIPFRFTFLIVEAEITSTTFNAVVSTCLDSIKHLHIPSFLAVTEPALLATFPALNTLAIDLT